MRKTAPIVFGLALGLGACGADSSRFAPEEVTTGIYMMTASTIHDDCDPRRFVGSSPVGVFREASQLVLFEYSAVPFPLMGGAEARYELDEADGYARRLQPLQSCGTGPANVTIEHTLTAADATSLEVANEQAWDISDPCPDYSILGADFVPSSTCRARRTLRYELVEACAAPCAIFRGPPGPDFRCECPH
jgi:hypothetical protein